MAGRAELGPVQRRKKDPRLRAACLVHELVLGDLPGERPLDDLRIDFEQLGGGVNERTSFAGAVPLGGEFLEDMAEPRPRPGDGLGVETDGLRDRVGGAEPDAADVEGEPVGVLAYPVHRLVAVEAVDARRPGRAHPVRLKEDHDLAHRLLLRPSGDHLTLALRTDPGQLQEPFRFVLDDLEHLRPEGAHELRREVGADAPDHSRPEVLLDAFEGAGRNHPQVLRPKLESVAAIVDPDPVRLHEFAGADGRGAADDRDRLGATGGVHAQHAEPGLLAVEGDAVHGSGDPVGVAELELEGLLAPPRCAFSAHVSSMFVAYSKNSANFSRWSRTRKTRRGFRVWAPRCRGSGPHGLKDAEGVVDTTLKRLEGVRLAIARELASAAGHR